MTIMGYADLALMSLAEYDPLKRALEEIKGGGKRAAALTRRLLAFSRRQILQPVVLDLNELIKGFVKMLERLIVEDVELETVLASELRRVEAGLPATCPPVPVHQSAKSGGPGVGRRVASAQARPPAEAEQGGRVRQAGLPAVEADALQIRKEKAFHGVKL